VSCFSVTAVFRRIPEVTRWLAITGVCVVLARAGEEVGLPAPQLLIGTAAGAVIAAVGKADRAGPGRHARANHALVGVLMGSYLDPAALAGVVGVAFASLAATLVTIVICVLAALLLARVSALSTRDAVLSLAPGGSAAIIASARELGADPWQVALAQSLRIAMVALTAPLLVLVVDPAAQPRTPRGAEDWSWAHAVVLVERPAGVAPLLVLTAVCLLGCAARYPAAAAGSGAAGFRGAHGAGRQHRHGVGIRAGRPAARPRPRHGGTRSWVALQPNAAADDPSAPAPGRRDPRGLRGLCRRRLRLQRRDRGGVHPRLPGDDSGRDHRRACHHCIDRDGHDGRLHRSVREAGRRRHGRAVGGSGLDALAGPSRCSP
jgi:membrane AbrB-like protein